MDHLARGVADRERDGPPTGAARIAKFWAAEAGARVAAATQQVHGGIGIDITYPLHRYFLWAKHNELTLGSATAQLARLGSTYTARKDTDDDDHTPQHHLEVGRHPSRRRGDARSKSRSPQR